MQFILSEEEYKKLIHKDRIIQPIKEFNDTLLKFAKDYRLQPDQMYMLRNDLKPIYDALETLRIKLDL